VARRYCRLLLGTALAVALAGGLSSTAFAKGDGLPLSVRILGAAGERQIDFVSSADLEGALAFNNQVADLEQMATPLVFSAGRQGGWPNPGLASYYEIDFNQPLTADRFPWNGMSRPQFYFYPARGSTPAYVRLHVTRGSQPAVDGWQPARPEFTKLLTPHLIGLTPIHPTRAPAAYQGAWLPATVLLFLGASVFLVGYFMPVVAMPRTK
jgi:hypothetical protein